MKPRVQHPKVQECKGVASPYWFFRYWDDEMLPDGTVKTTRKRKIVGPMKGPNALTKKEAEVERVFANMRDPHLLICETCIYTGTRISEALGLQLRNIDLNKGTIRIVQRHCRGDVDVPKTRDSRRVLALGTLTERYRAWIEKKGIKRPEDWVFPQDNTLGPRKHCDGPMWDSSVRAVLKKAAQGAGCDFTGFGLHSFRRANITLRQEVGGSAIEAQKIAGHAHVSMTGEYTKVQLTRQDELTRRIQDRIEDVRKKQAEKEREKEQAVEEAVA